MGKGQRKKDKRIMIIIIVMRGIRDKGVCCDLICCGLLINSSLLGGGAQHAEFCFCKPK